MGAPYRVGSVLDAKMGYVDADTIVYVDIPYFNQATQTQNPTEITYEGDNTTSKLFSSSELNGTVRFDKLSPSAIEKLYGKTAVEADLPDGVVKRLYFGDNAEFNPPDVELVITYAATGEDGSSVSLIEVVPKVRLAPYKPGDLGNKTKQTQEFTWTADKTTTDILGDELPGVPADGITWFVDFPEDYAA